MHAPKLKSPGLPGDIRPRTVGIIGFDGVSALDLIAPLEAFKAARAYREYHRMHSCYEVVLIALTRKRFVSESGVVFKAEALLSAISGLDTVIIPGAGGKRSAEVCEAISLWLRANASGSRRIVSISTGIFAVAPSGYLDGRQVATHWRFCQELAARFPKLHVSDTASFIKDGPFYTCGAGMAGMEMSLALIEEDYGPRTALEVAREFVLRLRPAGAERALIHPPQSQRESSERLAELPAWILEHLHENLSVETLSKRACVSPRHFRRLFQAVFRTGPAEFVEQLRLGEARRRLVRSRARIESVAASVGFKSADSFRRAFERQIGMTPSAFRTRLRAPSEEQSRSVPRPGLAQRHQRPMDSPIAAAVN